MGKPRKKPFRLCVGCGAMKDKAEMMRIVKNKEGEIFADPSSRAAGRGAYICINAECVAKAAKAHRFDKAFGCKVSEEVYKAIEKEIADCAK